jgi:TorA maturation chaperone TorD
MSRQIQYELLAMALSYPSYELLAAIKDGEFDRVFACQAPVPSSLEEMEIEYCRMFVGPGHVEAPPYESVYRGNDINLQKGCVIGQQFKGVGNKYTPGIYPFLLERGKWTYLKRDRQPHSG